MRFRSLTVLVAGATALATAVAFGPAASAGAARPAAPTGAAHGAAVRALPSNPNAILYDQNDNDGGTAVSSQNFESSFDIYDDSGADDFKIPKHHTWTISQVDVSGQYYNGTGPCRDETVTFYKSASGLPGAVIASSTAAGTDLGGSFQIPVTGVAIKAGRRAKKVWVGVVCNMDFGVGGQWGWEIRGVQGQKYVGMWENPGGGFGTCPTWAPVQNCVGFGPDWMFTIEGVQS